MRQMKSMEFKKKETHLVGVIYYNFFSYKIIGSLFRRQLVELKRFLYEYVKSVFFFSFVELNSNLSSEFRLRNKKYFFYKEEFNFFFIEHLLSLFFKVYLNGKKDFFLKRVVSFFFWFINMVSLEIIDESNTCRLLEKSGFFVKESKVFPSLSEIESDKVVISVNKKVCHFQAISLFCELIWNINYLTFFFFEKRRYIFFLGKLFESVLFFYEGSSFFFFFLKRKN